MPFAQEGHAVTLFFEFISREWPWVTLLAALITALMVAEFLRGGRRISPHQLSAMSNDAEALVVDLRDAASFDGGHIHGALNMPWSEFSSRRKELDTPERRGRALIFVCDWGQRSPSAARQLHAEGFKHLFCLKGGIAEWRQERLPLVGAQKK